MALTVIKKQKIILEATDSLQIDLQIFHPSMCAYKTDVLTHMPEDETVRNTFIKPYEETLSFVQNKSGLIVQNPRDMQEFFFIIKTEVRKKFNLINL